MKLSTKLVVAMVSLAAVTTAFVGFTAHQQMEAALLASETERQKANIDLVTLDFEAQLRTARADVTASQSSIGLAGLVRALQNGGFDPVERETFAGWKRRYESRLKNEVAANEHYLQFQLIGVADGGREIISAERGKDGVVRTIADVDLRRHGDDAHFAEMVAIPSGEFYISPIELNREAGKIATPPVPTMQMAAPVDGPDGKRFGILVINIDFRPAFRRMRGGIRPGASFYVVNDKGDFLLHPDTRREFGFETGKRYTWQEEMPGLTEALASEESGVRIFRDANGQSLVGAVASAQLAGGPKVSLIETKPYAQFMAAAEAIRRTSLLVGLGAIVVAALLAMFIARSLAAPLVAMTRAVKDFSDGKPLRLPSDTGDEIGTLAQAFQSMAGQVRQKTMDLEKEIEERKRIFETSVDLILITDRWGNIARVNPSSERILGYRAAEMAGSNASKFVFAMDLNKSRDWMRATRKGGDIAGFDARFVHKTGRVVPLTWIAIWTEAAQQFFFVGRDRSDAAAPAEKPDAAMRRAV